MKNIKSAISLALLVAAPAMYAQNIDTKANPDLPTYTVTLNVTNNGGGTDSVKIAKNEKDALLDSLFFTGSKTGSKLNYGTKVRIGLQATSGKKIKAMTVTKGDPATTTTVTWDASSTTDGSKGIVLFDAKKAGSTNYYSLPLGALKSKTDVAITWEDKATLNVTCEKTVQTVKGDNQAADAIVVKVGMVDKTSDLVKGYYKASTCQEKDKIENGVAGITKAGTYYVKLHADEDKDTKALDMVVPLVINNKLALTVVDAELPKIDSTYQEGQSLGSVAIVGGTDAYKYGDRVIKGTWSWADPNQLLEASGSKGNKAYQAIFTPDSSAIYNNATASIAVDAYKVATVTVSQTTGGVVSIGNATPDNKYVNTTTLGDYKEIKLIATPAVGYKFVKWVSLNDPANANSEAKVESLFTPTVANTIITAEFAKATRSVKLGSKENGSIKVLNGAEELDFSSEPVNVEYGTTLTIVAIPNNNYEVSKVGYTYAATTKAEPADPAIETTSFVVGGAPGTYTVSAVFTQKPIEKKMISLVAPINGSVSLLNAKGDKVNPNSSVDVNSTVTVIAMPNKGYKLSKLLAGETDITAVGIAHITTDTEIKAIFTEEEYPVSVTAPTQVDITGITSADKVKFGTNYQSITASIKEAYIGTHKLVSLLINNNSVTNGTSLKVEGATVISAQVEELVPVKILNKTKTEVIYDGSVPAYAVSTPTGLGGFEVSFYQNGKEVTPTAVGTYDVHIYREYDNMYATYDNKSTYKLEIKPGVPGIKKIALVADGGGTVAENSGEATVAGKWTTQKPDDREEATLRSLKSTGTTTVYFVPDDKNIGYVMAQTVTASEAQNAKKVTISYVGTAHGTVSVLNGTIPVSEGVADLTLEVVGKADKGYTFDIGGVSCTNATLSGSNITVGKNDITITVAEAAFVVKGVPIMPSSISQEIYYGNSLPAITGLDPKVTWSILYQKEGEQTTDSPKKVGTYKILASCDEGDGYAAVSQKEIGSLTIKKAPLSVANVSNLTASPIVVGDILSSSLLSGGQVLYNGNIVPGSFSWSTNNSVASITTAGNFTAVFTPAESDNYEVIDRIPVYVSLLGVQSYTVTFTNQNMQVTDAQNVVITSGTKVPVGMKLYITPTSGKIKELTFNAEGVVNGKEGVSGSGSKWYCIAPSQDFSITVVFDTVNPDDPDGTDTGEVTGITLNKTALTLPRKESFKLEATVSVTGNASKEVKWMSTDPSIASVDAVGTVKAIKVGKTTIIATTVTGGYTALCNVTVDYATDIEKILSESRIYSQNGQIRIEPAAPVEVMIADMTGRIVYNNAINTPEWISAGHGVYIVRLSASGKVTSVKVIVR